MYAIRSIFLIYALSWLTAVNSIVKFILPITKFLFFPSEPFIYILLEWTILAWPYIQNSYIDFAFIHLLWLVIQDVPQFLSVRPVECGLSSHYWNSAWALSISCLAYSFSWLLQTVAQIFQNVLSNITCFLTFW